MWSAGLVAESEVGRVCRVSSGVRSRQLCLGTLHQEVEDMQVAWSHPGG
jgi:hypothetical protein